MITAIIAFLVVAVALALVVAVARDQGPPVGDVALAYELAWDRLDFEALWSLSGAELRGGLDRKSYIAAKRAAYKRQPGLGQLATDIGVVDTEVRRAHALAHTHVVLRDGGTVRNELQLERRGGRWVVVSYQLQPGTVQPGEPR